jgi:hypothetical protein
MAIANTSSFISKLITAQVVRTLEDNLVAKKICRAPFNGEIKNKGDTVYFPTLKDPTVNTYAGNISYEGIEDDTPIALTVDQQKYFAFEVPDIEAFRASVDLESSQVTRAAYMLKQEADKYVLGLCLNDANVNTMSEVTLMDANALSTFAKAAKVLRENNVMGEEMFFVAPPFVEMMLKLAGIKFQINNGINGTGGVSWTKDLGFDLYISNQCSVTAGTPDKIHIIGGSYDSIAFAGQINQTETIRMENKFSDACRGLYVYGAKIIRPKQLITIPLIEGTVSV